MSLIPNFSFYFYLLAVKVLDRYNSLLDDPYCTGNMPDTPGGINYGTALRTPATHTAWGKTRELSWNFPLDGALLSGTIPQEAFSPIPAGP